MPVPPMPRLTPIMRGNALIPIDMLADQVQAMDRRGTWHLAQACNLVAAMAEDYRLDDKLRQGLLTRHLQLSGALLGSINARVSTFKFLSEVGDGKIVGGDPESYGEAKLRQLGLE